ncbi:MAG: hypothetical protein A3G93_01650 [Nitrospinae bacterium RIFCSPLOWO2_12_FULL_45_22]|nr:MAG: hypothetical protein A3G93_01650 [Nitrospinae bacterium RIFCSPLOWO2_12_FULL_45_22]
MRILFVTEVLKEYIGTVPMGILYLSAYLRANGHKTRIAGMEFKEVDGVIKEFNPQLVCYSVTTGIHPLFVELNKRLKEKYSFFSAFGGPHATFFPEIIAQEGIDGACIGEGELALLELVEKLGQGADIRQVQNWWIKDAEGILHKNPVRPLIPDLNLLPFPDRDLIREYESPRPRRFWFFLTGRGCPYNCTYCFNQAYYDLYKGKGNRIRRLTVDRAIEEILSVKETFSLDLVNFIDDCFVIEMDWLEEFADRYPETIKIPFNCNITFDRINKRLVALLKRAGCYSVTGGIESGNPEIRKEVLNRKVSNQQIIDACRMLKEAGMRVFTQNILALPKETLGNAFETLDINIRCRADYPHVSLYQPYPGTRLGELAIKWKMFDGNLDNIKPAFSKYSPLHHPQKRKLENLSKLFAFGVEFPFTVSFIKVLIHLPLHRVYHFFSKLWKGYCFKSRVFPQKMSFRYAIYAIKCYLFGYGG